MGRHVNEKSAEDVRSSGADDAKLIATLLKRNIFEVFGENDPERRRAAIREIYAEDAIVHAPPGTIVGRDALDKFAGDLRSTHPDYVYTPSTEPQVLHDSARLAWGSGPKGEPARYTGQDFILVRNGKIAVLYVYLDSPPV
jgi:SnoaL-like domain